MDRAEFQERFANVHVIEPEQDIRHHICANQRKDDLPTCIGELSELILELTRHQRNKMHPDDLLQELAHVQWAVWRLQIMFNIDDVTLRRAIQATFR